jgi:hypothetical protein
MTDDLDRNLMRSFAAAAAPLPDDDFTRPLMLRVAWRRRSLSVLRLAAVVSFFLVGAFATHALVRISLSAAERFGELLISPLGWILSLLVAVVVLRRRRLLRH